VDFKKPPKTASKRPPKCENKLMLTQIQTI
jgi:hypothetical protein